MAQQVQLEKGLSPNVTNIEDVAKIPPKPFTDFNDTTQKTPEEIEAERRFVVKIDLCILPLLTIMYFLASLVRRQLF